MDRNARMGVLQSRKLAMHQLSQLVVTNIPSDLPEIQQLRLKISQVRALILGVEMALQSLYERELPRSTRTVDENAFLVHLESRNLVAQALSLVERMKDAI
jgi:hypothetical protein